VLDYLAAHNLPLTHDNVFLYGKRAGAAWSLHQETTKGANKYRWQRDVAAHYAAEAAAAGDPLIIANLDHWATRRISADQLRPPGIPHEQLRQWRPPPRHIAGPSVRRGWHRRRRLARRRRPALLVAEKGNRRR
jgi:hypothetical protein